MRTLTRETKQLQDKVARILTEAGINYEEGDLLQKLVSAFPTVTGVPRPNANEYRKFSDRSNDRTRKIGMLAERMADIGLTPILSDFEWKYVVGQLVDMEDRGWKWEVFSAWFKSGTEYNRPKLFQISKKPKMLIEIYKDAFVNKAEPTIIRNEDGSYYG